MAEATGNPSGSRTEACKAIWQEISQRHEAISEINTNIIRLKQRLNSLTYISMLPADVLQLIFAQLICAHPSKEAETLFQVDCNDCSTLRINRSQPPIQAVSQVCHAWRELAISSPRLWTSIPTHQGSALMKEMCRRSAHLPLSVHIHIVRVAPSPSTLPIIRNTFKRLHRLEQLTIKGWSSQLQRSFSKYAGYKAPLLRVLVLHTEVNNVLLGDARDFPLVLTQPCPSLEVLALAGFPIRVVRPSHLPSLQELYMDLNWPASSTSVDPILSVLAELPLLRKLALCQEYPGDAGLEAHVASKIVNLPKAQSIRLGDFCVWLLNYLVLPSNVQLTLNVLEFHDLFPIPFESTFEGCVGTINSLLRSHFSLSHHPLVHREDEEVTRNTSVFPTALECAASEDGRTYYLVVRTSVNGQCKHRIKLTPEHVSRADTSGNRLVVALCESLPLTNVRSLRFALEGILHDDWQRLFRMLPLVESLEVQGQESVFCAIYALDRDELVLSFPLPNLKKAIFSLGVSPTTRPGESARMLTESLTNVLLARDNQRLRLEELEINRSMIDDIAQLETLVNRLTVSSTSSDASKGKPEDRSAGQDGDSGATKEAPRDISRQRSIAERYLNSQMELVRPNRSHSAEATPRELTEEMAKLRRGGEEGEVLTSSDSEGD